MNICIIYGVILFLIIWLIILIVSSLIAVDFRITLYILGIILLCIVEIVSQCILRTYRCNRCVTFSTLYACHYNCWFMGGFLVCGCCFMLWIFSWFLWALTEPSKQLNLQIFFQLKFRLCKFCDFTLLFINERVILLFLQKCSLFYCYNSAVWECYIFCYLEFGYADRWFIVVVIVSKSYRS